MEQKVDDNLSHLHKHVALGEMEEFLLKNGPTRPLFHL